MTLSIEKHNDHIFWFDLCPNNESAFISVYLIIDEKIAIIETGPACSHDSLVRGIQAAGLNLQDIDYVIPTHIHLDHFGGGGHFMEVCENAQAIVHPKAYKHVSAIENWWQGSCDFLGDIANLYGKHGIRCNTLSPSGVATDKLSNRFKKRYASRNALKRMAKVSDYAGPMIFLCSDASGYMTGANLVVDAGWSAK